MGARGLKAILDTSVLIAGSRLPAGLRVSISVVSLSELHFGAIGAREASDRRERVSRLGLIESSFPAPLPLDAQVARIWGQLKSALAERGANPRNRSADLAIAATAVAHEAVLITLNPKDLKLVSDLVTVRVPAGDD